MAARTAAIRSPRDNQFQDSELGEVSFDSEENNINLSFETGVQAYNEKDGWFVGKGAANLVSEGREQENSLPLPAMHFRSASTILFSQGVKIQHILPERRKLEEAGLEIYEFTPEGLNLGWR